MQAFSTSIANLYRQVRSTFFARTSIANQECSTPQYRPGYMLALEPRVLFSGAPIDATINVDDALQSSNDLFVTLDDAKANDELVSRLIVVDSTIDDIQSLITEVQNEFGTAARVLGFSSQDSSLDDLTALLSQFDEIDEVHVFTHGADGSLSLGQENFDTSALLRESELVAALRNALSDDGRVMLYGCNVAANDEGQQFVSLFAQLTGADFYASTDVTGSGELGGDWELEFSSAGDSGWDAFSELSWQGTLPVIDAGNATNEKRTHVSGQGTAQAVAMRSDGSFVGVFSSTEDGDGWGVYAQRYAADGTPIGAQMHISQTTALDQQWASIGMADNGDFVITWTNDGATQDVYARRYLADGTPATNQFTVNTTVTGIQRNSTISVQDDGSFIVVWEGNGGGDAYGIYLQRFDSSGAKVGSQTLVNTATAGNQEHATISVNQSGAFLVAWEDTTGIHSQRFNAAGAKVGGGFDISNFDSAARTSVLLFDDGSFAAAYSDTVLTINQIVLKTFSSSNTLTSTNLMGLFSVTNLGNPSLVGEGAGTFSVAWEGFTLAGDMDVYYQNFTSAGTAASVINRINTHTTGDQKMVSGSMLSPDHMVFAFSGAGPTTGTGVYYSIINNAVVLNAPPTAVDDNLGRVSSPTDINYSTLTSNDTDPEGNGISVIDFSRPTQGTLSNIRNDKVAYTSNSGYFGVDSFQYKIADNDLKVKHFWDLDNDGHDLPGGKDASVNGTTAGPGNKGLWFDRSEGDYLEIDDFGYSNSFTLDFEFYVDNLTGNKNRYLYSHGNPDTGIQIAIEEGTDLLWTVIRDSNDALDRNELSIDVSAMVGGWHRYTLVVQQGVGSTVFVDGSAKTSTTKGADGVNPNGNLFIGSSSNQSGSRFMQGAIGDIALMERALSLTEVANLGTLFDQITGTVSLNSNRAPITTSETFSTNQNTNVSGTVAGNDSDPDGDSISYVLQSGPSRGLFTFQADGSFTFDLNGEYDDLALGASFTEVVTYQVRDSYGAATQATATFHIAGLNDLPTEIVPGASTNITMNEDQVHNGTGLLANFVDVDSGDVLQVSPVAVDGPDHGSLVLNADGTFTYTPNANYFGTDQFIYRVEDHYGGHIDSLVNLSITDVPENPVFTGLPSFQIYENTTQVGFVTATHPENLPITFTLVGTGPDDAKFSLDPTTGRLRFLTPPSYLPFGDADNNGSYQVMVRAATAGGQAIRLFNVQVLNGINAPVFPVISPYSVNENTNRVLQLPAATDADNDVITYSMQFGADASKFVFNPLTRRFMLISTPDYESPQDSDRDGIYELGFIATDSTGRSSTAQVYVHIVDVNEQPYKIDPLLVNSFTTNEDIVLGGAGLLANYRDPDGDSLQVITSPVIGPTSGTLRLFSNGNFTYRPDTNFFGSDQFRYRISDGNGGFVDQDVFLTIDPVNDAPTLIHPNKYYVRENTTNVAVVGYFDAENDPVTFAIDGTGEDDSKFAINATTGRLQFLSPPLFMPPGDFGADGTYKVKVRVRDSSGGETVDVIKVDIVDGANAPTFDPLPIYRMDEGTVPTFFLPMATDIDGDSLTYSMLNFGDHSRFSFNSTTRAFTLLSPADHENPVDLDHNNVYSLKFRVTDSTGRSDEVVVPVIVDNVNESPVLVAANQFTIAENRNPALRIEFSDPDHQPLTYSLVNLLDSGAFQIDSTTGVIQFVVTPNYEAFGDLDHNNNYQVVVRASDGFNVVDELIEVHVTDAVEPGALRNDSLTVNQGANYSSPIVGVLNNDQFFDLGSKTILLVSGPAHGQLTLLADGTFSYQHDGTRLPSDSFTYSVIESTGATSTATANISVLMNPIALGGNATIVSIGFERFSFADLVRNESGGTHKSIVILSPPAFGDTMVQTDGSIIFDPQNHTGTTVFQYQAIVDGRVSNVAAFELVVTGANPSTAEPDPEKDIKNPLVPIAPPAVSNSTTADSRESNDSADETDNQNSSEKLVGMLPRESEVAVNVTKSQPLQSNSRTLSYSTRLEFQSFDLVGIASTSEARNDSGRDRLEWLNSVYKPLGNEPQDWFAQVEGQATLTASAAAGLISLGYLTWMIRGGVLLTTFASSLPTWQSFDPLPVVTRMDRSDDNDEGIDEMVEGENS